MSEPTAAFPNFVLATDVCELAFTSVAGRPEGVLAYVINGGLWYRLSYDPANPAPNGTTIVSAYGGPLNPGCVLPPGPNYTGTSAARWFQVVIQDVVPPVGGNAPDWYVNATVGLDTNDGITPLTPLKTVAELENRWRGADYNPAPITVHLQTMIPNTDRFVITRKVNPLFNIVFDGADAILAPDFAGLLTPATAGINRPANLPTFAQDGILLIPFAYGRVRIPLADTVGWLVSDTGGGLFRCAPFADPTTIIDPVPGDAYVIESPPLVPDSIILDIGSGTVVFQNVNFTARVAGGVQDLRSGTLALTRSMGDFAAAAAFVTEADVPVVASNCSLRALTISTKGPLQVKGGFIHATTALNSPSLNIYLDTLLDVTASLGIGKETNATLSNVCVDGNTTPTAIDVYGSLTLGGALYGQNNPNVVLAFNPWSDGQYVSLAALTVALLAVPSTGVIEYRGSGGTVIVPKDFTLGNTPFVDNATAVNSQAGLIQN